MTQLTDLQSLFQEHVVTGAAAASAFVGNASASAEERLGVYFAAYRLRLLEILRDDFPGLCALMDADDFTAMGHLYLEQYPSQHPSVRYFGQHLAEFLAANSNYAEQSILSEMAHFEWARGFAFDAPDAEIMRLEQLGALAAEDWPALRLQIHPSLQTTLVSWNIGPIWRAVDGDGVVPEPVELETAIQLAVWRRGITMYWRSFDATEACALEAFSAGHDFAAVCEKMCALLDPEEIPAKMAGFLNQWVTEGLILK